MKNIFKTVVAIVEWTALAAAITFGCYAGSEGASAVISHFKKKGGDPSDETPETVKE